MPARTGTVHVVTTTRKYKDQTYRTHLLRRSYREGGTVKNQHARQGSCRLIYAAIGCITFSKWALMTQSRSGLSVTVPMGAQLRVFPDQRAGVCARACRYRAWRAARMA